MTEYKVNLPKTDFPMRADLAKREPGLLKFWQDIDLYKRMLQEKNRSKTFILHDGPPYANGEIHLGHAANKIIKDIVNKLHMLNGEVSPYVPGWDCHGLPIELNVEKKIGRIGGKVSVAEFIAACHDYAEKQISLQREAFIRLGVFGEWDNYYKTMDPHYEANVIRALGKIIEKGFVEKGFKPVHWCIQCGSALAEAEVEYIDKNSPAIYVSFPVVNSEAFFKVPKLSVLIWTTTPWTLPANEAVSLNPTLEYVLIKDLEKNTHFIVAKTLLDSCLKELSITNYKILSSYLGKDLEGKMLNHPFLKDKQVPIILGEHVTTDVGTGLVHTAPAHGNDDYKIGLRYKLPVISPVGPDGKFLKDVPFFAGENVFSANEHVLKILEEHGNLLHVENIHHSYPHCWRHKTPLIFRATLQWFISMDKKTSSGKSLREKALSEIEKVHWIPQNGLLRIKDMIENRPDWCISRQRFWGTPMALFIHKETGELHPETLNLLELVAQNVEKEGIFFWYKFDAQEFLKAHTKNFVYGEYEKVQDTLDVWFDSGVSHFCVLKTGQKSGLHFPADLYLEGMDQYRGWFQSSLLTALAINDEAPYREVLTHGMTVDAEGRKMSKSLGNVLAPREIVNSLGADILRLWIASTYLHDDLTISDEILRRNVDAYRILRNTARFLLGNLWDFDPQQDLIQLDKMLSLDRWMVEKVLTDLQHKNQTNYEKYNFYSVASSLQLITTGDLSSFYFSIIKDRLYTMKAESLGRRSAQTSLFYILEIFVRVLAPILSFTAEEIWQEMRKMWLNYKRSDSVFFSTWYSEIKIESFKKSEDHITNDEWEKIKTLRDIVNKELENLRVKNAIGSSLAASVTLFCDKKSTIYKILQKLKNELRFVLITSIAEVKDLSEKSELSLKTEIPDLYLEVTPSSSEKCCRCWHYRADVGINLNHPELCGRCIENLFGEGEERFYA